MQTTSPRRIDTNRQYGLERGGVGARLVTGIGAAVLTLLSAAACSKDASGPPPADCTTVEEAPAVGTVTSSITGSTYCVDGGSSGAEYVLIPYNASFTGTKVSVQVEATGVVAPGSAAFSIVPGTGSTGVPQLGLGPIAHRDAAFEARIRAREAGLDSLIPGARRRAATLRARTSAASRAMIPRTVVVGQRLELNTNSDEPCKDPIYSIGRVVAVTSRSIVVADTANPAGGFTDADYQSIAATFDNTIDPLMTATFGAPADIDANGRIVLFFTRSVNEMTPEDSEGSYVGGFFFGRDLFPQQETVDNAACAGSNVGELFYLMVPDPTGVVNNNKFSTADVREIAVSIVAHEYQHLINASRRMYVQTALVEFEETWLNEGLSHIAEELLFYAQAGVQPRSNLDTVSIRATRERVDAFNADMGANFGRYQIFLENPSGNSPYADNDSLATRGATWSFLRYAVDQQTAAESSVWFRIVNSDKTGFANLKDVFGSNLTPLFRDWSTSLFADDVRGFAPRYQQPSWHFRSIYTLLNDAFPLKTTALADGASRTVQLVGGGSAFFRFKVPAGGAGQVRWGTLPSTIQMTVVRAR